MPTADQAKRLGRAVGDLGGRFMGDPAGFARAGEVGLEPGLGVYVAGRFGVLGAVDADVVAAAAAFWNPSTIRTHWEPAVGAGDPGVILPDDAPGRAYQLTHVLGELRFGLHVCATIASGLEPLLALATTPGMEAMVPVFGFTDPVPEPTAEDLALRERIEATTNDLSAASLVGVTDDEVEEMITIVEAMAAAAD